MYPKGQAINRITANRSDSGFGQNILITKGGEKNIMTHFKRQVLSVLATGSLVLNLVTPVAASTTLEVSGNGSNSDSEIKLDRDNTTTVVQNNSAVVTNKVSANADTGSNSASDNTGGDVKVDTGNAKTDVSVTNSLNTNEAQVACCQSGDTDVLISGNGTKSDNTVELRQDNKTGVFQDNAAKVENKIDADAKTGKNDADDNTGGDISIDTGNAETTVAVSTTANANRAVVGGGMGDQSGVVSAKILGNGSYSDNEIKLDLDHETAVVQDNFAHVRNHVNADADTGYNDADDNTGGEVSVDTGDATADVTIDNMVNFNAAEVDCGCLLDISAKVHGNGTDSDNEIKGYFDDAVEVFQGGKEGAGNEAELYNHAYADAGTGKNDADDNTGSVYGGDPSIDTGDAHSTTEIGNSGNVNVYGHVADWEMPEFDFNFNVSLSLSQLMALLGN